MSGQTTYSVRYFMFDRKEKTNDSKKIHAWYLESERLQPLAPCWSIAILFSRRRIGNLIRVLPKTASSPWPIWRDTSPSDLEKKAMRFAHSLHPAWMIDRLSGVTCESASVQLLQPPHDQRHHARHIAGVKQFLMFRFAEQRIDAADASVA